MTAAQRLRPQQRVAAAARPLIDDVLNLIDGIRLKPARREECGAVVPISVLNRPLVLDQRLSNFLTGDDEIYVPEDIFDMWPFRSSMLSRGNNEDRDRFIVRSVQSVDLKAARGYVRRPMRRMIRSAAAHIDGRGRGFTTQIFYGLRDDGKVVDITNTDADAVFPVPDGFATMLRVVAGVALVADYWWTVDIRAVGSNFTIRIPTSPLGARVLLSLRDVPMGRERRAALRHWVSEHCRNVPSASDEERLVTVREHLRGATKFQWEDLEGVVRPSPYDLRRAGLLPDTASPRNVAAR